MDRKIPLGVNSSSSKEGGSRAALRKKKNSNKKRNLTEYQTDTSEADIGRDYHGKLKTKKKKKKERNEDQVMEKQDNEEYGMTSGTKMKSSGSSDGGNLTASDDNYDALVKNGSILDIINLDDPLILTAPAKAELLLTSMITPCSRASFYSDHWEKKPVYAPKTKSYVKGLLSKKWITHFLENQALYYDEDIRVLQNEGESTNTSIYNSKSSGNEDKKQVDVLKILKLHNNGAIIELLCLQRYHDTLWNFLTFLEQEFQSNVTCTVSIVPSTSWDLGACHVSASDTFIVQMTTGKTLWKLKKPKMECIVKSGTISLESSGVVDGDESNSNDSESVFNIKNYSDKEHRLLSIGDVLYIPKGWGYQYAANKADTDSESESCIFLKLQCNEGKTLSDALALALPAGLSMAFNGVSKLRKSIPSHLFESFGVSASETEESYIVAQRENFMNNIKDVMKAVTEHIIEGMDASIDQMARTFIGARLPIPLTEEQETVSMSGAPDVRIHAYTKLRMLRPGIARVLVEENMVVVYHCMDNSRLLHELPLRPLEFDLDDGPTIEALLQAYPVSVMVADLPHPSDEDEDKVGIAQALYKEGFLLIDDSLTDMAGDDEEADLEYKNGDATQDRGKNDDDDDDDDPF